MLLSVFPALLLAWQEMNTSINFSRSKEFYLATINAQVNTPSSDWVTIFPPMNTRFWKSFGVAHHSNCCTSFETDDVTNDVTMIHASRNGKFGMWLDKKIDWMLFVKFLKSLGKFFELLNIFSGKKFEMNFYGKLFKNNPQSHHQYFLQYRHILIHQKVELFQLLMFHPFS